MAQSIALRSMPISNMALTAALVARVERKEPDPGPHYGNFDLSEETRERWLRLLLEGVRPIRPSGSSLTAHFSGSLPSTHSKSARP